jgi:hypothetical protein
MTVKKIQKRFIVPRQAAAKAIFELRQCLNTFNHRKLGKNHRGAIFLAGVESRDLPGGWNEMKGIAASLPHFRTNLAYICREIMPPNRLRFWHEHL